jgi:hypothetical protein
VNLQAWIVFVYVAGLVTGYGTRMYQENKWFRNGLSIKRSQSDASGETVDPDGNLAGPEFGDGPEFAGWAERSQPSGEAK